MNYFIHAVEETTIHKKINDNYEIIEFETEKQKKAEIILNDSFYIIESDSEVNSVMEIIDKIKVIDEDGDRVKLSLMFKRQKESEETNKDSLGRLDYYINKHSIEIDTSSKLMSATYELEKEEHVELHRFFFYIIKENEILKGI